MTETVVPTAMTSQVLNTLIRRALDADPDPKVAAAAVLSDLDPEQYRAVLALVLPQYTYVVANSRRNVARPATDTTVGGIATPGTVPVPHFQPATVPAQTHTPTVTDYPPRPVTSTKVAAVRDWWTEKKNSGVSIDGVYKRFGEVTHADARLLATRRREQAANTLEVAARYERYAEALAAYQVATVADLPDDVARALWNTPATGDAS